MVFLKKGTALAIAFMMLLCMVPVTASAANEGFENNNCLIIATEPGETSEHVSYYKHSSKNTVNALKWEEDEERGNVLSLNGKNEYLRIGKNQLRMSQMTFTTWINFKGSSTPEKPKGAYWQRLFTIQSDKSCYFTVSPHALDTNVTNANGHLDGVYMEYFREDEDNNYSMKSFIGAPSNKSHFGLPQNEWHHMAVVVDTKSVKMYVDGKLMLEEVLLLNIVQMYPEAMLIGGGLWGDPLLHALLDDTMLFDKALTEREVAALMQTGDLSSLNDPASATTQASTYEPTKGSGVVTTTTVPTEQPEDKPFAPFGLPLWGFIICLVLFLLVAAAVISVNVYEIQFRKKYGNAVADEGPVFNIDWKSKKEWIAKRLHWLTDNKKQNKKNDDDDDDNDEVFE